MRKSTVVAILLFVFTNSDAQGAGAVPSATTSGGAEMVVCGDADHSEETWLDCFNRIVSVVNGDTSVERIETTKSTSESAARKASQQVLNTETASDDSTSRRDFLNSFLAAIGVQGLDSEDGDLRFTYNVGPNHLPPPLVGFGVEAVAREPEVFELVLQEVPEEIRDDQKTTLAESLEDFDDIEFKLLFSFFANTGSTSWGQGFQRAWTDLFRDLVDRAAAESQAEKDAVQQLLSAGFLDVMSKKVKDSDAAAHAQIGDPLTTAAKAITARHKRVNNLLKDASFSRFGELVANQPQLLFTAGLKDREKAAGPDEFFGKLTFEFGSGNVNGLRKSCGGEIDLACYTSFLEDKGNAIKRGHRLKVELEYRERDDLTVPLGDEVAPVMIEGADSFVGALTYGVTVAVDENGSGLAKFDFEAKFDNTSGESKRQDRLTATATLSRRVSGDMALAVSFIWANKPEFRGMVDEELSARAGLKFSIN